MRLRKLSDGRRLLARGAVPVNEIEAVRVLKHGQRADVVLRFGLRLRSAQKPADGVRFYA